MDFGYKKNDIMALLDSHLQDVNAGLEEQINKMKQGKDNPQVSLATLITSSMLSMLDAVSAVIEVNNKKIHDDLVKQGLLKTVKKAKPAAKVKAKTVAKAKPKAKVKVKK